MKLNTVLLSIAAVTCTLSVHAAEPAPVVSVDGGVNLTAPNDAVTEKLISLERKLDARNRTQVNVQRQLDELQNEVNELRGITELHSHQLDQVLERQRELYQELERRVSQALKPIIEVPSAIVAPSTSASTRINYSSDLSENEAYDHAVNLVLKDKNYQQAIPEFQAFNKNFPNSNYAANAHYWLGQLLFNKGDLSKAQQEFEHVVSQFPDSRKRGDAMLKLAMVAQQKNDKTKAIALYRQLLKEYPNSSAAQLAQPRLDSLI